MCGVILAILLTSCAGRGLEIQIERPVLKKVTVKDGTIKGKELDNVISNHKTAWKYIRKLEKLGKFKVKK